jgi:predicted N-acetyltransferase YhbS
MVRRRRARDAGRMLIADATTTDPTVLRPAAPEDADACGRIFFDAFATLAERHAFPVEPGSPQFTAWLSAARIADPGFHAEVAERDGVVVGCAFADERDAIVGIGPVTVDPAAQDAGAGRALMRSALDRAARRGAPGVRLVQTAYHYRSLALYAKLGFQVREPLSVLAGPPLGESTPGVELRAATVADLPACGRLCGRVHGHERTGELRAAIEAGTARVAGRRGRITAYATGIGYGFHAVGETSEDIQALIAAADGFLGLGVLVPTRDATLLGWCLERGLRIVQQSTLMTAGLYSEPAGGWLPSISY